MSPLLQGGSTLVIAASIIGALIGGYASDWKFGGRRMPVVCVSFLSVAGGLTILVFSTHYAVIAACLLMQSFGGIGAIHSMLTGAAAMDVGGEKATSSAAGLFDGAQYAGGALAGIVLGTLIDAFGWSIWVLSMIVFAVIGGGLAGLFWKAHLAMGHSR